MRILRILFVAFLFFNIHNPSAFSHDSKDKIERDDSTQPFVIAELFTSEGCSSCPAADKILSALTRKARKDDLRIFTLGFHVDYWDYLGWRDRFSNLQYTARQRQYGQSFHLQSIYTPQLILNGIEQFGGYRKDLAEEKIDHLITQAPATILNFTVHKQGLTLKIDFETEPKEAQNLIHFAVVERNINSDVRRGENAGKNLLHDNVVRTFVSVPANNPEAFTEFSIPPDVKTKNATVIGYVQDKRTMAITGANYQDL